MTKTHKNTLKYLLLRPIRSLRPPLKAEPETKRKRELSPPGRAETALNLLPGWGNGKTAPEFCRRLGQSCYKFLYEI